MELSITIHSRTGQVAPRRRGGFRRQTPVNDKRMVPREGNEGRRRGEGVVLGPAARRRGADVQEFCRGRGRGRRRETAVGRGLVRAGGVGRAGLSGPDGVASVTGPLRE